MIIKKFLKPVSRHGLALLLFAAQSGPAISTEPGLTPALNPAGLWTTIDDSSHKPASQVRIWSENNLWLGRIEYIFDENNRAELCKRCKGELKDQPVQGMTILWGMRQAGNKFDNGKILDPENGKTYSASMKILGNGNQLEVRGYIGHPAIGRSQVWERIEESNLNKLK